ncbi:hypothetical protein ADUPG1_005427, partial [Aduncisulcus paluster]
FGSNIFFWGYGLWFHSDSLVGCFLSAILADLLSLLGIVLAATGGV